MKRAHLILNLALVSCLFTASANGATITWASGASGNWSNPANWNPNHVPGPADTAIITAKGNYTVTVDTSVTVSNLVLGSSDTTTQTVRLNGQYLDLGHSATVNTNGVINMSSGALAFDNNGYNIMNGTLTCSGGTLSGVLTIASNALVNLAGISSGTQTVDFANLTLTNYGTIVWSNLDIQCPPPTEIYNYNLLDIQSDNTFAGNSSTILNNYGTIRKNIGTYAPPNYVTRFNTMTLNNSGTVDVEMGAITFSGGNGGGLFITATNAGVSLGDFTLTGATTFTGPGQVQGTLYGQNGVIHGSMAFDYGSFSGTLTVATDGVVNLVGIDGETTPIGLNDLTLTNCGTVAWSNIDLDCSSVQVDNFGLWDAQSDNTFYGDAGNGPYTSTFYNYGTVRKDGGSATTTFDGNTTFTNCGTVDVESAQLNLGAGYGGGLFNTATNATLWLGNPGSFNLSGSATFTGPGLVWGNLVGNYPAGVIRGSLNFYYGSLGGFLTVASNAVMNLVFPQDYSLAIDLNGLTLTNCGTVVWSNADLDCSSVQVYNHGLWDAQSDNTFYGDAGNGPYTSTFYNYGTVRKDGGSATTTFDGNTTFTNCGTVDVETAQLNLGAGYGGGLFDTATNATLWLGNPGSFNLSGSATFTGPGLVWGNLVGNYPAGVIQGSLNFYYGSLGGFLTVASNAVVNLAGISASTQALELVSLTLTNCGTIVWSNIDLDCFGTQIYNHGLWDALSDNTFYGSGGGPYGSTFNNYGTVRKNGGSAVTTFDQNTTFTNSGTVDVETAQINIDMGSGGGLFNTAGNAIVWLGIPNNFNLSGCATFTGPGLVGGNLVGDIPAGIIQGSLNFYYGSLGGYLTVASNAVVDLTGISSGTQAVELVSLTFTNYGTVVWSNIDLDCSGAQIYNHGLWDVLSDNTFHGGGGPSGSTFNNCGTVRKDGGRAITTFDGNTTFNNPGKTDVQTGQVTLAGSCSLTNGTLNLGICGPSHFGVIDFANYVQLTGRLSVNFRNHYMPVVSNSFPVVVYGWDTGTFTSLSLPSLSAGLGWQTSYTSTAFTLSTVAASPLYLSAGLSVSGNSTSLSWDGLLGQTYQVQCTTNLDPANWVNLGDPIIGTNGPITVLDSFSAGPDKYYRVQSQ